MKKIIILIVGLVIIGVGAFFAKDMITPLFNNKGELKIESNPKTTVFINGEEQGETPFQQKIDPGEYDVKLIPEDESSTTPWQHQVKVNAGVQTFVSTNLGPSEVASSWEIITLEKLKSDEMELSIFSQTDSAEIFIDGERKGTTPLSLQDLSEGTHDLRITSVGFAESTITVKTTSGYKLDVATQLARLDTREASIGDTKEATPSADTKKEKVMVKILDTPTGWLRVRDEASTAGEEVAKVDPGKEYAYIEEEGDWYKIEYEEGKEGWISSGYAEKVE